MAKTPIGDIERRRCSECPKWFQPKNHKQIVCSPKCNRTRALRKKREYYQKNKAMITFDPKPCVICGAEFTPRCLRDQTCSHECSLKWKNIGLRRQILMGGRKYPYLGKSETEEIDELRRHMGLRPIKRGTQTCSCGNRFHSEDLTREHMCDSCRARAEHIYTEAGARHIGGGMVRG